MIVCICRRISDRDIRRAAGEPFGSFEAWRESTGLGACCGNCLDCARETWETAAKGRTAQVPAGHGTPSGAALAG